MKPIALGLMLGLAFLAEDGAAQVTCNYSVTPLMSFGSITGLPTPQIDVVGNISVTCSSLLSVNHRVCLSIPAGTGGVSIADRRMVYGGQFVQYQLYTNAARTTVWGALGATSPPQAVDFPLLIGSRTVNVPVYGRVFAGQTGKSVGTYQSILTPIVARRQSFILFAPSCQDVTANATTLSSITTELTIDTDCTVSADPLDFGSVTAMTGHTATTNLSVTCTLDGPFSVALDGGSVTGNVSERRMQLGAGPQTVNYQLYRDAGLTLVWGDTPGMVVTGTGTGSPESLPVYGSVPAQAPTGPGTYQDVITVTVTF